MDTTLRISKAVPTRAVGPEKSTSDARMPAQRKDMPRTSSRLLKIDPITTEGTRSASVSLKTSINSPQELCTAVRLHCLCFYLGEIVKHPGFRTTLLQRNNPNNERNDISDYEISIKWEEACIRQLTYS